MSRRLELECRLSCPSCSADVKGLAVQRLVHGRLSSSTSTACPVCGAAEETDGGPVARSLFLRAGMRSKKHAPASAWMIEELQRADIEFSREGSRVSFEATSVEIEFLRERLGAMSKFVK